jgi:hypothetical protein
MDIFDAFGKSYVYDSDQIAKNMTYIINNLQNKTGGVTPQSFIKSKEQFLAAVVEFGNVFSNLRDFASLNERYRLKYFDKVKANIVQLKENHQEGEMIGELLFLHLIGAAGFADFKLVDEMGVRITQLFNSKLGV